VVSICRTASECNFNIELQRADHIGDNSMEIVQPTKFTSAQREVRDHDVTIILGYAAFAIVLLIAIYLGSLSSGTAPGDFATMTVFP